MDSISNRDEKRPKDGANMNKQPKHPLILASASPRRKALLQQIGIEAKCHPVDIDERPKEGELPADYVSRLALEKAAAGWDETKPSVPVMGADTIVVFDGQLLGQPEDEQAAKRTLQLLSGQTHQVYSAVAVVWQEQSSVVVSKNQVTFGDLKTSWIEAYVASGEPMDKAGCYGIQGQAAIWIKNLSGSYSSVMGLPLYETAQLCRKFDIIKD